MNVRRAVLFVKIVTAFILKGNELGDEQERRVLSGRLFLSGSEGRPLSRSPVTGREDPAEGH